MISYSLYKRKYDVSKFSIKKFISNSFREIFGKPITPGIYVLDIPTKIEPFDEEETPGYAEVLEVKEGHVKYRLLPAGGTLFQNMVSTESMFKFCWKRVREADWIGKIEYRFNWRHLRYNYGRWHFNTNCCGETTDKWWVWEKPNPKEIS